MAAIRRAIGMQRSTDSEIEKCSLIKRKMVPTKLQKRQVRQRMLAVIVPAGVTSYVILYLSAIRNGVRKRR